jgi:hypothetical protein
VSLTLVLGGPLAADSESRGWCRGCGYSIKVRREGGRRKELHLCNNPFIYLSDGHCGGRALEPIGLQNDCQIPWNVSSL